ACQRTGQGTGNSPTQEQLVYVTSVTGSGPYTVNFTPRLYMPNWSSSNSPIVNFFKGAHTITPYGNGLEDLTIYASGLTSNFSVALSSSYASWVKGVRFLGSGAVTTLYLSNLKSSLLINNYMFSVIAIDSVYPP